MKATGIHADGWTAAQASIEGIELAVREGRLVLQTNDWHPWRSDPERMQLRAWLGDTALPFLGKFSGGYAFALPGSLGDARAPLRLTLRMRPFVPAQEGMNMDPRELGLDLAAVEMHGSDGERHVLWQSPVMASRSAPSRPGFTFDPSAPPIEELRRRGMAIGEHTTIHFGTVLDAAHFWLIEIGSGVTIAPRCHILAHDASTKAFLGYSRVARVVIEDHVFIGADSVVLPGVRIGRASIIGAGSVVSRSVPPETVAAGNPARPVCSLAEFIERRRAEFDRVPRFDIEYTGPAVDSERQRRMREALADGFGYVV